MINIEKNMKTVQNVGRSESGQYFCQPSIGPQHSVMVHVLDRYTDVLPVLGEGIVHDLDIQMYSLYL